MGDGQEIKQEEKKTRFVCVLLCTFFSILFSLVLSPLQSYIYTALPLSFLFLWGQGSTLKKGFFFSLGNFLSPGGNHANVLP